VVAVTDDRPWGPNNPSWRVFGLGGAGQTPGEGVGLPYAVVLVGDDPDEADGDPARDAPPGSPGAGALLLRAHAFGPNGARRIVETLVVRGPVPLPDGRSALRVVSWREVR